MITNELNKQYAEIVEKFLRELGATEETASEYEIRLPPSSGLRMVSEIWHKGSRLGTVCVRFEPRFGHFGQSITVDCVKED